MNIFFTFLKGTFRWAVSAANSPKPVDDSITILVSNEGEQKYAILKVRNLNELRLKKGWKIDLRTRNLLSNLYSHVKKEECVVE